MSRPLVSIVTPSYNQGAFIEDTLRSVAGQDYPNVEHIVVDGGSTDETVDILSAYEDEYDLQWTSEPDEGQSDAINEGFDRVSGDIVGWLNSDDVYFDTGVFDRVADSFKRYGDGVIYGDLALIDEDSTVVGLDVRPEFDADQLFFRNFIGQPALFFDREVLEGNRLDVELYYSMDYEFWVRLSREHSFRHVADILAGFRTYPTQKSQALAPMEEEVRGWMRDYRDPSSGISPSKVVFDLLPKEVLRFARGTRGAVELSRHPPELAFDGSIGPLGMLLYRTARKSIDPNDVLKTIRRLDDR